MSKYERDKILTLEDLGDMVPFFRTKVGRAVGKAMMKIFGVDVLNAANAELSHLEGPDFAAAVLRHPSVRVSYRVHGEEQLERMREGRFLTVSNHPFGGLDGLILVDIVGHLRPDFKVLVNSVLSQVRSLESMWVPVVPNMVSNKNYVHDPKANIKSIRNLAREFNAGYPIGLFPAGGVGRFSLLEGLPIERPWKASSLRILKRAESPIFPIMFGGHNSQLFYYLKENFPPLSDMMLPREMLNKKDKTIDVYIGAPILPEETDSLTNIGDYARYVVGRSMSLLPRSMYEPQIGAKPVLYTR